jgi:hypothetical protein
MFYYTPANGAIVEGRQHRKGATSMKLSSYAAYHEVNSLRSRTMQRPEVPGIPLIEYSYEVKIRTFPIIDSLGPIKRYDTVAFWRLSFQEILRHLGLASQFTNSPIWPRLMDVISSYREEIIEVLHKYFEGIVSHGDMSLEQFEFYVKEHGDSASPFGPKWSYFLENKSALKIAHERTNRWIKAFVQEWRQFATKQNIFVNPKLCYPALRARPGEPTIIEQTDRTIHVLIRKWRDRKAGGIKGLSQISYPIYQKGDIKKKVEAVFYEWFKKVLKCDIHSLSQDGPQVYKDIIELKLHCHDIKTGEKQVGLAFKFLPFVVDLSYNKFAAELAAEMYSGIGPTTPLNEMFIVMMLRAMMDEYGLQIGHLAMFSDNFAVDVELPESPHFESDEFFCGFDTIKQIFGPASLCTDNPDHRLNFAFNKGKQIQVQSIQYIMKPLLAVVTNGVADRTSPMRFINFVIDHKIYEKAEFKSGPKDMFKQIVYEENGLHDKFIDNFSEDREWVERWFPIQTNNADFPADIKIY